MANAGVRYVKAMGGPTANPLWNQIKADVLGIPLWVARHPEGSSVGAARLALRLVGESDVALRPRWTVVSPRPERRKAYDQGYQLYRKAFPLLKAMFDDLSPYDSRA
jgi:sugar (pentulose or hexulose) kinase